MKSEGLNLLLPRITLRLPRIGVSLPRPSVVESLSVSPLSLLASCGSYLCQLPVSLTATAANTYCALSRNRAFPALPFATLAAFPLWESVLPRITLRGRGAV